MNINELSTSLRQPYSTQRPFGTVRCKDPKFQHLTFIVPPPPPISLKASSLPKAALALASGVLSRLPSFEAATAEDRLFNFLFARQEALQSSRMEGTYSTIEAVLMPSEVLDDPNISLQLSASAFQGRLSIQGYAHTLERHVQAAAEVKEQLFTRGLIEAIHRDITDKDPAFRGIPGEVRKVIAWISGRKGTRPEDSAFNPPLPEYVEAALDQVLAWLVAHVSRPLDHRTGYMPTAPVFPLAVRIALAHGHFEAVHPFSDGNGRVGRALWPLQMVAAGYFPLYLSGYVEAQKADYVDALGAAQKKLRYAPLIEFICTSMVEAEHEMKATRVALQALPAAWLERGAFRAGSTSQRALGLLTAMPLVTAKILSERLQISRQAAHVGLSQLTERGIVSARGKRGHQALYAAEEVLELLARPFGSNPAKAVAQGQAKLMCAQSS